MTVTFTRILLNPQKRGGRKLLSNPQAMHAAVRACFPPDLHESAGRILWRVDEGDQEFVLYVVAPEEPDRDVIVDQAGWSTRPGATAAYTPLLEGLRTGHERAFRLTANPVQSLPADGDKRGRVVPHVTPAQQVSWLIEKAPRHGFEIRSQDAETGDVAPSPDVTVDRRKDLSFTRRDPESDHLGKVTLRTARFTGSLRITDADAFRRTLTSGFGRGRAYGCGLLTIARLPR